MLRPLAAGRRETVVNTDADVRCAKETCQAYWLLATGYWLLDSGCWLLAAGYWLPGSWLLDTVDWRLV